jgi:hypothetical protein
LNFDGNSEIENRKTSKLKSQVEKLPKAFLSFAKFDGSLTVYTVRCVKISWDFEKKRKNVVKSFDFTRKTRRKRRFSRVNKAKREAKWNLKR